MVGDPNRPQSVPKKDLKALRSQIGAYLAVNPKAPLPLVDAMHGLLMAIDCDLMNPLIRSPSRWVREAMDKFVEAARGC